MEYRTNIKKSQEFSVKEKNIIDKILLKYDFKVIEIVKVRSVYKVTTDKGIICLKKIKHEIYKANNGYALVDELTKNGFSNVAKYIKTSEGELTVNYKKYTFYATQWINGTECNLNNLEEAINCTKLLAKFHTTSKKIDSKKLRIKSNLKNWPMLFSDDIQHLEKFKKIIESKKLRSTFDVEYYNHIDNFYNRALMSMKILNASSYYKLSKAAEKNKTICHDSFYYQNLIKKGNKYYIIDLDSIIIDLQVNDLGKMIRRLMFKKEYEWDFSKAKMLIEAYNEENKLSTDELEVMLSLIIFPHKFCKLGKKRYIKHKTLNEATYLSKLKRLIKYVESQENFAKDYIEYIHNLM